MFPVDYELDARKRSGHHPVAGGPGGDVCAALAAPPACGLARRRAGSRQLAGGAASGAALLQPVPQAPLCGQAEQVRLLRALGALQACPSVRTCWWSGTMPRWSVRATASTTARCVGHSCGWRRVGSPAPAACSQGSCCAYIGGWGGQAGRCPPPCGGAAVCGWGSESSAAPGRPHAGLRAAAGDQERAAAARERGGAPCGLAPRRQRRRHLAGQRGRGGACAAAAHQVAGAGWCWAPVLGRAAVRLGAGRARSARPQQL